MVRARARPTEASLRGVLITAHLRVLEASNRDGTLTVPRGELERRERAVSVAKAALESYRSAAFAAYAERSRALAKGSA